MARQMAIMSAVSLGMRDVSEPCMWFSTTLYDRSTALQVLSWQEAFDVIKEAGVYDVNSLKGKPCEVEVGNGMIKFIRVLDLK